jgi:hypothetical protein
MPDYGPSSVAEERYGGMEGCNKSVDQKKVKDANLTDKAAEPSS